MRILVSIVIVGVFFTMACDKKQGPSSTKEYLPEGVNPKENGDWSLINDQSAKSTFLRSTVMSPLEKEMLIIKMGGLTLQEAKNRRSWIKNIDKLLNISKDEFEERNHINLLQNKIDQIMLPLLNKDVAICLGEFSLDRYDFENKRLQFMNTSPNDIIDFSIKTVNITFTNVRLNLRAGLPMDEGTAKLLTSSDTGTGRFLSWVVFVPSQFNKLPSVDETEGDVKLAGPAKLLILIDGKGRIFYSNSLLS